MGLGPGGIVFRGIDSGADKGHAFEAVFDGGEVVGFRTLVFALHFIGNGFGGGEINVGESFDEGFGVAEGKAGEFFASLTIVGISAAVDFAGFVEIFHDEFVGMLLMPFERGFGAVNADIQVVFLPVGNLGGVEDSFGAAFVADQHVAVVVESAARNVGGEFGGEFVDFESGDVSDEVFGMGTDVTDAV